MDAQSLRRQVESLIKAEWTKIDPTRAMAKSIDEFKSWSFAVTPPIPAAWPPDGKGVVYYYAYAYGMNPSRLADGEWIAAPWARVKVDATGQAASQLEMLTKGIKEVGIQGVRPLRDEEIKTLDQQAAVEEQIQTISKKTSLRGIDAKPLKQFFQLWCSTNGVIVEQLRSKHPQFFDWVGCK
jgi:hypothetical protein